MTNQDIGRLVSEPSVRAILDLAASLGLPVQGQEAGLVALAEHMGGRWVPLSERLPEHNSQVWVAYQQDTGHVGQCEATFYGQDVMIRTEEELADYSAEERAQYLEDLALVQPLRHAHFCMSGGDWDATFPGPAFTRQGWDYGESDRAPLVTLTHWRAFPPLPYGSRGEGVTLEKR